MDKTLISILHVLISIDADLKLLAVVSDTNLTTEQKISLLDTIQKNTEKIADIVS